MKASYDVVVIGAGPAGSVASYAAARRGAEVLLVDKASFPRDKVCGCCLNARAIGVLERLDIGDVPRKLGARPLDRLNVYCGGAEASMGLSGGVSVSRRGLDMALAARAQDAGVTFKDNMRATVGRVCDGRREVTLHGRDGGVHQVGAGVVVVADGLAGTALRAVADQGSRVAPGSRMGAGAVLDDGPSFYEPGVIYMACGQVGYVGLVRLEDGRLDVAAALDMRRTKALGGPGGAARSLLAILGLPAIDGLNRAAWRGTAALTRYRPQVAGERMFVLGDAAGYVEPFTGEGMAWAMAGAEAVSGLVVDGVRSWHGGLEKDWQRRHAAVVRKRQRFCRAVAALMRRPRMAGLVVRTLGFSPRLAEPVVRMVTRAVPA